MSTPLLHTVEDAASLLSVDPRTIYRLISGDAPVLASVKVRGARRIPADALVAYIESLREAS